MTDPSRFKLCTQSPFLPTLLMTILWVVIFTVPSPTPAEESRESPRHQEWVAIANGDRKVQSFLVYPEVKDKALAVVIIHENRGLTDWVRSVADRVAEAGYIAIAPDLLSGTGPNGGRTNSFADSDAAREALYQLQQTQITADLNAVVTFVADLPAANGKVAVAGFCWGGKQSFQLAVDNSRLAAAFVFYGTGPDPLENVVKIRAPVYGFYGGNDARVNQTISTTTELMKQARKRYEPVTYEGAGHGFMRKGDAADGTEADKKAKEEAWDRWLKLLKQI